MVIDVGGEPNKVVTIIGVGAEIGQATGARLGSQGHRVLVATHRDDRGPESAPRIRTHGALPRVHAASRSAVAALVDGMAAEFGRVDVLVSHVGLGPVLRPDRVQKHNGGPNIDINVRSLLHGIAAALPHFRRQGGGHFVILESSATHDGRPFDAGYSTRRAAAEGLRLDDDPGIRTTTISLGLVGKVEPDDCLTSPTLQEAAIDVIAGAISYAIAQPPDIHVSDIVIRSKPDPAAPATGAGTQPP